MIRLAFVLLIAGLCLEHCYGRPYHIPTFAELTEKADLVVVVRPISTSDRKDGEPLIEYASGEPTFLTAVVTRCRVLSILKGDLAAPEIMLPHYRLDLEKAQRNGVAGIGNGPRLLTFPPPQPADVVNDDRPTLYDYLIFLKREPDGDFALVSGQTDPIFSVFRVSRAGN